MSDSFGQTPPDLPKESNPHSHGVISFITTILGWAWFVNVVTNILHAIWKRIGGWWVFKLWPHPSAIASVGTCYAMRRGQEIAFTMTCRVHFWGVKSQTIPVSEIGLWRPAEKVACLSTNRPISIRSGERVCAEYVGTVRGQTLENVRAAANERGEIVFDVIPDKNFPEWAEWNPNDATDRPKFMIRVEDLK